MIPYRIIRSVPERVAADVERRWTRIAEMHPNWRFDTYRDPINPEQFPITAEHWPKCRSGAQLAGLIRLEALWHGGGIWLDSDVDIVRPLDPLLHCKAFAAWEDRSIVPDAVLGAVPHHPALDEALKLAVGRLAGTAPRPFNDWRDDRGAWATGPGVTTTIFPGRNDVMLLGPDSFYPVHYAPRHSLPERLEAFDPPPWTFGVHRWAWSWR